MAFQMPAFDRDGKLVDNYTRMLFALGLLSEDVPGVTLEMAEQEVARLMLSYSLNGVRFDVGPNKYKSAAFIYGLWREKGQMTFLLTPCDIDRFCDYMTDDILDASELHPGSHPSIDLVRQKGGNTTVEVALPDEA